jgi:hypothetical protein
MAVSLYVSGRLCSPDRRAVALDFAAERARDMEWEAIPVAHSFTEATLREGSSSKVVKNFRAEGLALRPHFACDPLPLLFAAHEPILVDSYVHEGVGGARTVESGAILNTLFGGPGVHREVCEFLADLNAAADCSLKVDDETTWFDRKDDAALDRAFAAAWRKLAESVREDGSKPGRRFSVGEFPFVVGDGRRRAEFEVVGPVWERRILDAEGSLSETAVGSGYSLNRTVQSVEDLELLASDFADPDRGYVSNDAEREAASNHLGAAFGRTLIATLGGHWAFAEDDGLCVADVGGSGLIVDPVVAAFARLTKGPVHSMTNHFGAYRSLARAFGTPAEGRSPTS